MSKLKILEKKNETERTLELLDELFSFEQKGIELEILQNTELPDINKKKRELLKELRVNNIFVLERGDIESYYPKVGERKVPTGDKPTQGQKYCDLMTSKEHFLSEYEKIDGKKIEFELMFNQIFK